MTRTCVRDCFAVYVRCIALIFLTLFTPTLHASNALGIENSGSDVTGVIIDQGAWIDGARVILLMVRFSHRF